MAEDICNRLDKLIPPPFFTLDTPTSRELSRTRREVMRFSPKWSRYGYYDDFEQLMSAEIDFLTGFIIRKGQQLRSEKALQLTKKVQKLAQRWRANEFQKQLRIFRDAFANKKEGTVCRSPSSQWATYIVYLMMRDVVIMAKMKLECESAVEYWLGLISKAHHWRDSLVITAILSRIWLLSSNIVSHIVDWMYPTYQRLLGLIRPTKAAQWPDYADWEMPLELDVWIREKMKLSVERARLNVSLSFFSRIPSSSTPMNDILFLFSKSFENTQNTETAELLEGSVQAEAVDTKLEVKEEPMETSSVEFVTEEPEEYKHDPLSFLYTDRDALKMESDIFCDTKREETDAELSVMKEEEDLGVVVHNKVEKRKRKKVENRIKVKRIRTSHLNLWTHLDETETDDANPPPVKKKEGRKFPDRTEGTEAFASYWAKFSMECIERLNSPAHQVRKLLKSVKIWKEEELRNGCPEIVRRLAELHSNIFKIHHKGEIQYLRSPISQLLSDFDTYIQMRDEEFRKQVELRTKVDRQT